MGRSYSSLLVAVAVLTATASLAVAQTFQDELANLQSPNVKTRVKAAKALGASQRPEAVQPLVDAVRDPEVKVRKAIVQALRSLRSIATVDGLLAGLTDEEKDIRSSSMDGVIELYVSAEKYGPIIGVFKGGSRPSTPDPVTPPETKVVRAVEARLRDEEPSIRQRAVYMLGILEIEESVEVIARALPDMNQDVRNEVVLALGRIGGEVAGQALIRALADSSKDTRRRVMEALGRMRYQPAARALMSIWDANQGKPEGDRALEALGLMGATEARGIFYQNLTNIKAVRRRYAVEGLGRLNDTNLLPGLTKDFLREPEAEVQLAYCFSIALLGRPEFIDRLALSLSNHDFRDQTRGYLVELGSPYMSELVTYLSDPVSTVRREMVQVLMDIGDPTAIPFLEPLLRDADSKVSDWANRAIARLQRVQMAASAEPSR